MLLLMSALNMADAKPAESGPSTNEMEAGPERLAMGNSIAVIR